MDQENMQEETTEQADEREATPKNREKRAPSLWPAIIFGIIAISCWINCGQTMAGSVAETYYGIDSSLVSLAKKYLTSDLRVTVDNFEDKYLY